MKNNTCHSLKNINNFRDTPNSGICKKKLTTIYQATLVTQMIKNVPAKQETQVQSLGQEDPLEKEPFIILYCVADSEVVVLRRFTLKKKLLMKTTASLGESD